MPRLPELTMEIAPPTIQKMMEAQQAMYGCVVKHARGTNEARGTGP
jgi:hypothetical protein